MNETISFCLTFWKKETSWLDENGLTRCLYVIFLSFNDNLFLVLHIMIDMHGFHLIVLMVVWVLKKFSWLRIDQIRPKLGPNKPKIRFYKFHWENFGDYDCVQCYSRLKVISMWKKESPNVILDHFLEFAYFDSWQWCMTGGGLSAKKMAFYPYMVDLYPKWSR